MNRFCIVDCFPTFEGLTGLVGICRCGSGRWVLWFEVGALALQRGSNAVAAPGEAITTNGTEPVVLTIASANAVVAPGLAVTTDVTKAVVVTIAGANAVLTRGLAVATDITNAM